MRMCKCEIIYLIVQIHKKKGKIFESLKIWALEKDESGGRKNNSKIYFFVE